MEAKRRSTSSRLTHPSGVTANIAHKGKQSYSKTRYHHSSSSSHSSARSVSPGSNKRVICQYCEKPGHTAKICCKIHGYPPKSERKPAAHHAHLPAASASSEWILDSGGSHHITNELDQLHLSTPYTSRDQLIVGDGAALPISHTGKFEFSTPSPTLHLP